jgi:cytochrome c oxidase assembly protein subunit 15
LFIEHGHRLLGASAGILVIALVAVVWSTDRRGWMRAASVGALALVVVQGLLGGMRVVLDARVVAMVHGCVGPLFFAYLGGLVITTSTWWQAAPNIESVFGGRFARGAWMIVGLAYLQLVLGAILRHVPLGAPPAVFRVALVLHLIMAAAVTIHVAGMTWRITKLPGDAPQLRTPGVAIATLVLIQLLLGVATYAVKYAFPAWLGDFGFAASFVVQEKSLTQSLITTAHVANGSLILFIAAILAIRSTRLFSRGAGTFACPSPWQTGMSAGRRTAA